MHTEERFVDQGGDGEVVEREHDLIVQSQIVLVSALRGKNESTNREMRVSTPTLRGVHNARAAAAPCTALLLTSSLKLKKLVSCLHSWFPRSMKSDFG